MHYIEATKQVQARQLAQSILGDMVESWPLEDIYEFLEADGYGYVPAVANWMPVDDGLERLNMIRVGGTQ